MPIRLRRRLRVWPYCGYWGWWHHSYALPPPWLMERPTPEEEIEDLKEHIEEAVGLCPTGALKLEE